MFRKQPQQGPVPATSTGYVDRVLLTLTGLYALLPFGRWILVGAANQVDLAVATLLLILVFTSLAQKRSRPRSPSDECDERNS